MRLKYEPSSEPPTPLSAIPAAHMLDLVSRFECLVFGVWGTGPQNLGFGLRVEGFGLMVWGLG